MGFMDNFKNDESLHDEYQSKHKAELSHELVAGAASFYAARKYEEHVAKNGTPDNHAVAKELLAGFAGAFIDREVETKGLDFIDKQKAKHEAKKRAEQGYDNHTQGY